MAQVHSYRSGRLKNLFIMRQKMQASLDQVDDYLPSRATRGRSAANSWVGGAQPLRQYLQQLPSDRAVPFDQRAKLPKGEPVAHQVARRGHRGGAGAAVDQGELAEAVAGAEGGEVDAFARDRGFAGVDDEEGGAPGALHDHGLALGERALLQQAGDLLGLPAVHVGEELDPAQGGHGVAPGRDGRRRVAATLAGGDGAALEELACCVRRNGASSIFRRRPPGKSRLNQKGGEAMAMPT